MTQREDSGLAVAESVNLHPHTKTNSTFKWAWKTPTVTPGVTDQTWKEIHPCTILIWAGLVTCFQQGNVLEVQGLDSRA